MFSIKGYRPSSYPDTTTGCGRRFRVPEEQVEVEHRLADYIRQMEKNHRIRHLPKRGSGKSARAMSAEEVERAVECQRVLGEAD
jgi:hypothetical protein